MAKVDAPLLSFGSSGTIAKTQVYSRWRGIAYARRWVKPGNPQTSEQTMTRSVFTWASNAWKFAGSILQAPWDAYATGQAFVGRNAFIGQNTQALRPGSDLTAFIGSPGALGGLAPLTLVATPGTLSISCAMTAPSAPTGWTLSAFQAVAIKSGDPHGVLAANSYEATNATSPVVITVPATGAYDVFGWTKWLRPDGKIAYGSSIATTATVV